MSGNMERVLKLMAEKKASDVYISVGSPMQIKISGQMVQLSDQPLTPEQPRQLLAELLSATQLEELEDVGELNVGMGFPGIGSFRLSAFRQRGSIAAVFRCIPMDIPSIESLRLPPVLSSLILEKRGLILLAGATGTGKSTTLASMLEHRNRNLAGHILTIEDPIEFLFTNKKSLVNQREVGRDTQSLQIGLKNALRQAPDCILIGEIRDRETMTAAISYALSGHLVVSTLHANNSYHALGRILSFYTPEARPALLGDLSSALKAVVSQRLVKAVAGGRVPAVEVLLNTKLVADHIAQGNFSAVKQAMEQSLAAGSQPFEEEFARLINEGVITREEGIAFCDSPTNLIWRLQNEGPAQSKLIPQRDDSQDAPSFTEIMLEVRDAPRRRTGFGKL